MADCTRPSLEICEGVVACLPISLDKTIDVQGIYVVEEGAILQRLGQGAMATKVAMDSEGKGAELS